ncbi:MAG: NAD(P)H-dependent oxidoreductase [Actinomycetota bacterium]
MPSLLVVHHSPGVSMPAMLKAAIEGASQDGLAAVAVEPAIALEVTTEQFLGADAYLLATPANLGYMSGALKHAFDTTYNDLLDTTRGRPFGMLLHGESDTTGAELAIVKIATGLGWRPVAAPVSLIGPVDDAGRDACHELGAVLAASTL